MYSRGGIGFLRELREGDPIGWLKPDEYIGFVNGWRLIEIQADLMTPFLSKNFGTTGRQALDDVYPTENPANLNPNNVLGLPRYSWSDAQYSKLRSSQIR